MTECIDPESVAPPAPIDPHSFSELAVVFRRPLRVIDVVLGEKERFVATVASGTRAWLLCGLLLSASLVFASPYGLVLGLERFWNIPALFVGSMLICFPSLQVFSAFVGLRIDTRQNLSFALLITTVAALFSFGFFPILWFLDVTMESDSKVSTAQISIGLLSLSILGGLAQLGRCLALARRTDLRTSPALLLAWNALFLFISFRMAGVLEII